MVPPAATHFFDDYTDMCVHCGAVREDAGMDIGCEAGPEGNPDWYFGLALTPAEQAAGMTSVEKARQQDARRQQSSYHRVHGVGPQEGGSGGA